MSRGREILKPKYTGLDQTDQIYLYSDYIPRRNAGKNGALLPCFSVALIEKAGHFATRSCQMPC